MMLIAGSEDAEARGPEAERAAVFEERLDGYHLFHAARAEMLRRLGQGDAARDANRRALELTANPAERRLLGERIKR